MTNKADDMSVRDSTAVTVLVLSISDYHGADVFARIGQTENTGHASM